MDLDLKALTEATAGAVGGVLSTTILYPLDTCKTKFQAEAQSDGTNKYRSLLDVLREAVGCGKVLSLYQGLATKNGQAVLAGFVYFYSYSYFKDKCLALAGGSKMGLLANLAVAASAGACTALITQPLDTLSARMQTSKPGEAKSLMASLREGGVREAFDGLGISLILTCNPAIQYTVFEQLKEYLLQSPNTTAPQHNRLGQALPPSASPAALSAFSAFLLGALSKCIATVVTYPLIRCKVLMQRAETEEERRLREQGDMQAGRPRSMAQAFRIIWHAEGVAGLYKGLQAQMLKTVLAAALMLMIKEKVSEGTRSAMLALQRAMAAAKAQPKARASQTPSMQGKRSAGSEGLDTSQLLAVQSSPGSGTGKHGQIRGTSSTSSGQGAVPAVAAATVAAVSAASKGPSTPPSQPQTSALEAISSHIGGTQRTELSGSLPTPVLVTPAPGHFSACGELGSQQLAVSASATYSPNRGNSLRQHSRQWGEYGTPRGSYIGEEEVALV